MRGDGPQASAPRRAARLRGHDQLAGNAGRGVRLQPAGRSGDEPSRPPDSDAGVRPGSVRLPLARLPELRALTAAPTAASARATHPHPGTSPGTLARGPIDARIAHPSPPRANTAHTAASHAPPRLATAMAASATKMP